MAWNPQKLAFLLLALCAAGAVLGGDSPDPEEHKDLRSKVPILPEIPEKFVLQPVPMCAKECYNNQYLGRTTAQSCAEICFFCNVLVHEMFRLKEERKLEHSVLVDFCSKIYPERGSEERSLCRRLVVDAFDFHPRSPPTLKAQWNFHLDTQLQDADRYQQAAYMCEMATCCAPLDIPGSALGMRRPRSAHISEGPSERHELQTVVGSGSAAENADVGDEELDNASGIESAANDDVEFNDMEKVDTTSSFADGDHGGDGDGDGDGDGEEQKAKRKMDEEDAIKRRNEERRQFSSGVTAINPSPAHAVERNSFDRDEVVRSESCKICTDMMTWAKLYLKMHGDSFGSPMDEFCSHHEEFDKLLCNTIGRRLLVTSWSRAWLDLHYGGYSREYTSFRNHVGSSVYEKLTVMSLCVFTNHCQTHVRAYDIEYYRSSFDVFQADKAVFKRYIEDRSSDVSGLNSLVSSIDTLVEKWTTYMASTSMSHVIFAYKAANENDPSLKRVVNSAMADISRTLSKDQEEVTVGFGDLAGQTLFLANRLESFAEGLVVASVQREDHQLRMEEGASSVASFLPLVPLSLSRAISVEQSGPDDHEAQGWYERAQGMEGADHSLAEEIKAASASEVLIGVGGGGRVYSTELDSGTVVLKRLTVFFDLQFERNIQEIRANLAIKEKIMNLYPEAPFVKFLGFFPEYNMQAQSFFTMVYEYVPYDLEKLLQERSDDLTESPEVVQEIAHQLIRAVYLMSAKADLIHRDLKLENVLMKPIPKDQPLSRGSIQLKVADYDRSLFLSEEKDKPYPNRHDDSATTPDIMPPEALATAMTERDIRSITCGMEKGVDCLNTESDSCPFPIGTEQLLSPFVKKRKSLINLFEKDKSIVEDLYQMAPGSMLEAFDIWSVGVMLAQVGSGDRFFMEKVSKMANRRSEIVREAIRESRDGSHPSRSRSQRSMTKLNEYGAREKETLIFDIFTPDSSNAQHDEYLDDSDDGTSVGECGKPDICVGDALWENRCRLKIIFLASHLQKNAGSYRLTIPDHLFFERDLPGYVRMLSQMLAYEPSERSLPFGHDFLNADLSQYAGARRVRTRSLLRLMSSQLYEFRRIPRLDICDRKVSEKDYRPSTCLVCHIVVDVLAELKLERLVGKNAFYIRCISRMGFMDNRKDFCKAIAYDLFMERDHYGPKLNAYLRAINVYEYFKGESSKATEICQYSSCCAPTKRCVIPKELAVDMCGWCRNTAALWTEDIILNPKKNNNAIEKSLKRASTSVCPSQRNRRNFCLRSTSGDLLELKTFARSSRSWWMNLKEEMSLEDLAQKFASAECDFQCSCVVRTQMNRAEVKEFDERKDSPMGLVQAGGAITEILHTIAKLMRQHSSLSKQRLGSVQSTMELFDGSEDWSEASLTALKSYKVATAKHAESAVKLRKAMSVFAITLRDVDRYSAQSLRSLQLNLVSLWHENDSDASGEPSDDEEK